MRDGASQPLRTLRDFSCHDSAKTIFNRRVNLLGNCSRVITAMSPQGNHLFRERLGALPPKVDVEVFTRTLEGLQPIGSNRVSLSQAVKI